MFADVFGKSARSITEHILAHPGETFDVAPFVDGRCKHPIEEIQAAVDGAVSREQSIKLRECLNHIDEIEAHRQHIEAEILALTTPYAATLQLLRTVPGFDASPMTAIAVLAEIGGDMSVFPTAKNLCSWAGCCPRNDQSGDKVKFTRISRAGPFLKPLLVQVANALIRSKKNPEFAERYRRIKARRGHKKAIIAICRMLLTAIWNMLTKLVPYSPLGFLEPRPSNPDKMFTVAQALHFLRLRGYSIQDEPLILATT